MVAMDEKVLKKEQDRRDSRVKNFYERRMKMDSARAEDESEWHYTDLQTEAKTSYDSKGKLIINIKLERVLLEINDGKYSGPFMYDVIGSQENNSPDMIQPVYFALQDFLDNEGFYLQKKAMIRGKAKYGTCAAFTGLRYDSYIRYEPDQVFDGIYTDNMKAIKRIEYKYCPENRPMYTTWFDDQAMNQRDYTKADDCIIEDNITVDKAKELWNGVKGVDINDFKAFAITDPAYGKSAVFPNQCIISQKYNKITGDRDVLLNRRQILFSGKYYHNGELPVHLCQHYPVEDSLNGEGIPKRVRGLKGYKKSILQDILDASKMSAGINLLVPNGNEVIGQVSSGINVRSTTGNGGGAGGGKIEVVPMQTKIADMAAVLAIVDDLINVEVGENIRAPYTSPKTTLGEIEIMEEKQQTRDRNIEQSLNIFADSILTTTARNLVKYAVNLQKNTTTMKLTIDGEEKEVETEIFPNPNSTFIRVKDHTVKTIKRDKDKDGKSRKNKIKFIEDFGEHGYFSLADVPTNGEFLVKLVTPSTKPSNAIQKDSFNKATKSLLDLSMAFSNMGIDFAEEARKEIQPSNVFAKWKQLNEIDTGMVSKTKKSKLNDEIKKEQAITQNILGDILAPNPATNATAPTGQTTAQDPQANGGQTA